MEIDKVYLIHKYRHEVEGDTDETIIKAFSSLESTRRFLRKVEMEATRDPDVRNVTYYENCISGIDSIDVYYINYCYIYFITVHEIEKEEQS